MVWEPLQQAKLGSKIKGAVQFGMAPWSISQLAINDSEIGETSFKR